MMTATSRWLLLSGFFICLDSAGVSPNADGKQTMALFVHKSHKRHFWRRHDVIVRFDFGRLETRAFHRITCFSFILSQSAK